MKSIPMQIGKYRITDMLGSGGMGVVYKGYDESIDRQVAVKVLHGHLRNSEQGAELHRRFQQEARAAARFLHPNIVAVFDFGQESAGELAGAQYIAMEYVEGDNLKQTLLKKGGGLAVECSVAICGQVLMALGAAHLQGVVHRDIKPANIIRLGNGQVKVMDFGVARLESSELTQSGCLIGTPSYMSPEGLCGRPVDTRSDLYSLGVVMLELLTGSKPRVGEDIPGGITRLLGSRLPAHPIRDQLQYVLLKAMALAPSDRYQTAEHFQAELEQVVTVRESDPGSASTFTQIRVYRDHPSGRRPASTPDEQVSLVLSSEARREIEATLAGHIGPMAKLLLRKNLQRARSYRELTESLGQHVPDDAERRRFITQIQSLRGVSEESIVVEEAESVGAADSLSEQRPGEPPAGAGEVGPTGGEPPTEQELVLLIRELTYFVGPIAGKLVRSTARKSSNLVELCEQLASKFSSPAEREDFLAKAAPHTIPETSSRTRC